MNHKFTEQVKQWLEKPEDKRDYAVGALYLLKLSGNQIMYRNLIANPSGKAEFIEYQLQKYYNFRVQALTHAPVEEMAAQIATIADEHHLTDDASTVPEDKRRLGKREGLDTMFGEAKAKYLRAFRVSNVCASCIYTFARSHLTTHRSRTPSDIPS